MITRVLAVVVALVASLVVVASGRPAAVAAPAAAPSVSGVSPASGTSMGGTVVTVTGTGLGEATSVTFGGLPAESVTVQSDTVLTAVAPGGAGTVELRVLAGTITGTAGQYNYRPGARFSSMAPVRVLDTRTGEGPVRAGANILLDLSARVPVTATAVVLNVTGTNATRATYVTAWPADQPRPLASNLNLAARQTAPNLVTVAVDNGRLRLFNDSGTVDLVADLAGYYSPAANTTFTAQAPVRVLDTRSGTGAPKAAVGPTRTIELDLSAQVPASATAAVLNLTGTNATSTTFVTAWPAGEPMPLASNLNLVAGRTTPNLATVAVTGGKIRLYNRAGSVDLIADLAGYYSTGTGAAFVPMPPKRVLDTRDGTGTPSGKVDGGGSVLVDMGAAIAPNATGAVLNVTATEVTATTFVTAWPHGQNRPVASNLNPVNGSTSPNLVVGAVGDGGTVDLYNRSGSVHLIADLAGYFVPDLGHVSTDVEAKPNTAEPAAEQVVDVTGDPNGQQTTTLAPGASVPAVGGQLVTPGADGVLGKVTAVTPQPGGGTAVTTTPTSLDQAYSDFAVSLDRTLTDEDVTLIEPGTRAQANTPFKLDLSKAAFTCTGDNGLSITLITDLTKIHAQLDLDIRKPSIHFLLTVRPTFDLNVAFTGQVSCKLKNGGLLKAKLPIPAAPYLSVVIQPAFQLTAGGQVGVNFRWEPNLVFGFDRSPGVNQDVHTIGSNSDVRVTAKAGFEVFAGLSVGIELAGGRAAVSGELGPVLTSSVDAKGCRTVELGLRAQITASVDLFVASWSITIAGGTFRNTRLLDTCRPGPRSWGTNWRGDLGVGTTGNASSVPVQPLLPEGITKISGQIALRNDGTVWAWGPNGWGNTGRPPSESVPTPVRVFGLLDVVDIEGSGGTNYAVRRDGTVWGWGYNNSGQLGSGRWGQGGTPTPTRIPGLTGVVSVSADLAAYAIRNDGTVWGWGQRDDVLNTTTGCYWPGPCLTPPIRVPGLTGVTRFAASIFNDYAVKSDGTVWARGDNNHGQLGLGDTQPRAGFTRIPSLTGVLQVAAASSAAVAVKTDGTVWAWGDNSAGVLGAGPTCLTCKSTTPVRVANLSGITSVTAAGWIGIGTAAPYRYDYAMALRNDGVVFSWGDNSGGKLGNGIYCGGQICPTPTPQPIPNLNRVKQIDAAIANGYAIVS